MSRGSCVLAVVLAITPAACHATLGDSVGASGPDAAGGGAVDAAGGGSPSDGQASTPPDAAPACFNGRVVYLNFDGVTLAQSAASDATQNQASWIGVTTAVVPPYHAGDTNRMGEIQSITAAVASILSSFPITVVNQRPATGPYVMIVFGGQRGDLGTPYTYATNEHDCGDTVKSDVGWVSDVVPDNKVADYAVGAIAWGLGLNGTNDPADCMCEWGNGCVQNDSHCTLSASKSTTSNLACADQPDPQSEIATFDQAFCQ